MNSWVLYLCLIYWTRGICSSHISSKISTDDRRLDTLTARTYTLSQTLEKRSVDEEAAKGTMTLLNKELDEFADNGCPAGQFRCSDLPQCISPLLLCDGDDDCRNGADESREQCGILWTTAEEDEVHHLPGLTCKPTFKHYSGYLRSTGTKRLHYWFLESTGNPSQDPLVLWLNGGPGCSSLDGLLTENGPFLVANDGVTLVENPYSWNKVANMLYLESPAGVGFSYSDDKQYETGDRRVSLDNYWALKDFFKKFPQFSDNEFYITGESYAGMYIPTLAVRLMDNPDFNLKGIAVGNGINDYSLGFNSLFYFSYYHGVIGDELWDKMMAYCCYRNTRQCNFDNKRYRNSLCDTQIGDFLIDILPQVNIYSLYSKCEGKRMNRESAFTTASLLEGAGFQNSKSTLNILAGQDADSGEERNISPCLNDTAMTTYLRQESVRQALHIPEHVPAWKGCSVHIFTTYDRNYMSMTEQYLQLLQRDYRALIYSGDWDMVCPYLGAQWFVDNLNQELIDGHREWYYTADDGTLQIAGHVKTFRNLVFATVKGAGHPVPKVKPRQALKLFTRFLQNKPL